MNRAASSAMANSMAHVAPVIASALEALFLGETVTIKAMVAAAGTHSWRRPYNCLLRQGVYFAAVCRASAS